MCIEAAKNVDVLQGQTLYCLHKSLCYQYYSNHNQFKTRLLTLLTCIMLDVGTDTLYIYIYIYKPKDCFGHPISYLIVSSLYSE